MSGGMEFLFWLLFTALVGITWAIVEVVEWVRK